MRSIPLLLCALTPLAACGGQKAQEEAQSPGVVPAAAPTPSAAGTGAQPPPVASSSANAPDASTKSGHTHDPGRGLEDIHAIIAAHRDEARLCYDNALAEHPGMEGDLVITWTIDPKGNVTHTSLDLSRSQITEPGVIACISDVIKKIQFAPSPGGFETRALYPFNFRPRHSKAQ